MRIPRELLINVILTRLPEIADTNQIADVLGLHRRTIARWVKLGLLQGTRTAARGGKLLIARQALIRRLTELGVMGASLIDNGESVEQATGGER